MLEDDDQDFLILTRHLASLTNPSYGLVRATTPNEAVQAISDEEFDAALIDHRLCDGASGLDFVRQYGGRQASFPMIMLTGMDASGLDREALLVGAYDYIEKLGLTREVVDRAIRFSIKSHQYETQLRDAMAEAQEQATINRNILSIVSHEMKSPISSIKGYSEHLIEQAGSDNTKDAARKMKSAATHLEDFLRNLSEFVRLDSGAAETQLSGFNLKQLLVETVDFFGPYANHKAITLKAELSEEVDDTFLGDRLRIRQIIINLLKNAINYSDGGSITVAARIHRNKLELSVCDEGAGMSSEKVAAVLADTIDRQDPSKDLEGGLGLGLSICRRLLRLMGGKLTLESTPGFGTTAGFTLPLTKAHEEAAA